MVLAFILTFTRDRQANSRCAVVSLEVRLTPKVTVDNDGGSEHTDGSWPDSISVLLLCAHAFNIHGVDPGFPVVFDFSPWTEKLSRFML
jgi:hypothetical protein